MSPSGCRHIFGTTDPLRETFLCNDCGAKLEPERVSVSAAIARLPTTFEDWGMRDRALEALSFIRPVLPCPWMEPTYCAPAST